MEEPKNLACHLYFQANVKQLATHLQRDPPSPFQRVMAIWIELFTTSVLLNIASTSFQTLISF